MPAGSKREYYWRPVKILLPVAMRVGRIPKGRFLLRCPALRRRGLCIPRGGFKKPPARSRRRSSSLQKVTLRFACSLTSALATAALATNFLQIHGCALARTAARRPLSLLRYCRASRYRVESLCIAAPTPARCIRSSTRLAESQIRSAVTWVLLPKS
mgnify:CR=1 FL=1